jgi:hypothetical protein
MMKNEKVFKGKAREEGPDQENLEGKQSSSKKKHRTVKKKRSKNKSFRRRKSLGSNYNLMNYPPNISHTTGHGQQYSQNPGYLMNSGSGYNFYHPQQHAYPLMYSHGGSSQGQFLPPPPMLLP